MSVASESRAPPPASFREQPLAAVEDRTAYAFGLRGASGAQQARYSFLLMIVFAISAVGVAVTIFAALVFAGTFLIGVGRVTLDQILVDDAPLVGIGLLGGVVLAIVGLAVGSFTVLGVGAVVAVAATVLLSRDQSIL